ncbi:MAG: hypothetical protein GY856_03815 [bacterium]|nr:hypothetical protein [bacterium]
MAVDYRGVDGKQSLGGITPDGGPRPAVDAELTQQSADLDKGESRHGYPELPGEFAILEIDPNIDLDVDLGQ